MPAYHNSPPSWHLQALASSTCSLCSNSLWAPLLSFTSFDPTAWHYKKPSCKYSHLPCSFHHAFQHMHLASNLLERERKADLRNFTLNSFMITNQEWAFALYFPEILLWFSPTPSLHSLLTDDLTSFFPNRSLQAQTPSLLLHHIHKPTSIHAHLLLISGHTESMLLLLGKAKLSTQALDSMRPPPPCPQMSFWPLHPLFLHH